jgi:hypothetical protein
MSTYDCDLITKFAAARLNQSSGVVDGDDKSGVLLYATTRYTFTGSEAVNDTFNLAYLPKGAVPVPQLSHASHDGTGATALTLNIGDGGTALIAANATRYAAGISIGGATAQSTPFQGGACATVPNRLTEPTKLVATLATKTGSITAGKVLCVTIAYRVKG